VAADRWIATTPTGHRVRLSHEVWVNKVLVSHPELGTDRGYEDEVRQALEDPEFVVEGWAGELLSLRWSEIAPKHPKYLCVVFREADPLGFVITAFFISRYGKLLRRSIRWRKLP
jgi:hypothetical protein